MSPYEHNIRKARLGRTHQNNIKDTNNDLVKAPESDGTPLIILDRNPFYSNQNQDTKTLLILYCFLICQIELV